MANILERTTKSGKNHVVRYYKDGQRKTISFDSTYTRRDVEAAANAVESYLIAEKLGEPLDRKTANYFATAPTDLLRRLSALGFSVAQTNRTVADVWTEFERQQTGQVKPGTETHRATVWKRFAAFFSASVRFVDLTPEVVQKFRDELDRLYAPTTVAKSIADLRTFANWAVARGYSEENPFLAVRRGPTGNRARDYQVPREWTDRILDACPSQSWRTLYCLWRLAGLRQQEPLGLTRDSVDLSARLLRVHSTKTERYGEHHADRIVPIVPKLAQELERQIETQPRGERFLIYENRRKGFDSGFRRILFDAGLERWPKLFQNLRSSCENDWIREGLPPHVVAGWLGHSVKTQETYYLRILPEYFDRVTKQDTN